MEDALLWFMVKAEMETETVLTEFQRLTINSLEDLWDSLATTHPDSEAMKPEIAFARKVVEIWKAKGAAAVVDLVARH